MSCMVKRQLHPSSKMHYYTSNTRFQRNTGRTSSSTLRFFNWKCYTRIKSYGLTKSSVQWCMKQIKMCGRYSEIMLCSCIVFLCTGQTASLQQCVPCWDSRLLDYFTCLNMGATLICLCTLKELNTHIGCIQAAHITCNTNVCA